MGFHQYLVSCSYMGEIYLPKRKISDNKFSSSIIDQKTQKCEKHPHQRFFTRRIESERKIQLENRVIKEVSEREYIFIVHEKR